MELRAHLEFIGRSRWPDMDARLARLEELATEVSVASGVIARLDGPDATHAARALSKIAVTLAADVVEGVGPEGEFRRRITFEPLDEGLDGFLALVARGSDRAPLVKKSSG